MIDGEAYATGPNLLPDELRWQWSEQLSPSQCAITDSRCVVPDAELGLTMTGIEYGGVLNTLILRFDPSESDSLDWLYREHFVE